MTLAVQFTNVSRQFGEVKAVDRVSIDIQDGEFFSMLGPSGSGKTTCLRLIAGFEQPSAGSIRIHGVEAAGLPPSGGCDLFQYLVTERAAHIHEFMARRGILLRLFEQPASLRFGLPDTEDDWQRLGLALNDYRKEQP